jgi:hypothetical protein
MRKKTSPRPLTGKIGITVHPKRNPSQVIGSDFHLFGGKTAGKN